MPLKEGALTTTAAMGNWSIIDHIIDRLTIRVGRERRLSGFRRCLGDPSDPTLACSCSVRTVGPPCSFRFSRSVAHGVRSHTGRSAWLRRKRPFLIGSTTTQPSCFRASSSRSTVARRSRGSHSRSGVAAPPLPSHRREWHAACCCRSSSGCRGPFAVDRQPAINQFEQFKPDRLLLRRRQDGTSLTEQGEPA